MNQTHFLILHLPKLGCKTVSQLEAKIFFQAEKFEAKNFFKPKKFEAKIFFKPKNFFQGEIDPREESYPLRLKASAEAVASAKDYAEAEG